jgi:hypothetical protein
MQNRTGVYGSSPKSSVHVRINVTVVGRNDKEERKWFLRFIGEDRGRGKAIEWRQDCL